MIFFLFLVKKKKCKLTSPSPLYQSFFLNVPDISFVHAHYSQCVVILTSLKPCSTASLINAQRSHLWVKYWLLILAAQHRTRFILPVCSSHHPLSEPNEKFSVPWKHSYLVPLTPSWFIKFILSHSPFHEIFHRFHTEMCSCLLSTVLKVWRHQRTHQK